MTLLIVNIVVTISILLQLLTAYCNLQMTHTAPLCAVKHVPFLPALKRSQLPPLKVCDGSLTFICSGMNNNMLVHAEAASSFTALSETEQEETGAVSQCRVNLLQ